MKNKRFINKKWPTALAISLFSSSSLVMSANFDPLEFQQNKSADTDQTAPFHNELGSQPSFLDSLQQAEVDIKKSNIIEVQKLLNQGKLKEAKEKISNLLKDNPGEPEYYNLQAEAQLAEKNALAAQQSYQKAIDIDPRNIKAYFGLALINMQSGNLEKAKEYFNKTLAINDKFILSYQLLADIAYSQKQFDQAETTLLTALEKVKGNITKEIDVIYKLGKFYGLQKKPEKFLLLSEELVKRYPDNNQAMSILAGAQIGNNKKIEAEQTLRQLIKQDKQDANLRLLLAKLLIEQPDKEKETLQLLDEAAAIDPNNHQATGFKMAYLIKLQRYADAMELAKETEKSFPKLNLGKVLQGNVYLAEKKLDKALESYQQAYKIQPDDQLLIIIASLLETQKKLPEAISLLNQALEKNPKSISIHFKIATVYQQLNNTAQAEKHYQAILADFPENVLVLNNLALLYDEQKNYPQAIEFAKKAYTKAPDSAAIADTYGYILTKQGQLAEGLTVLEKAASLAPAANDIQFHLAEAYAANSNNDKSVEILEKITKSEQMFSEKKAAVDLLNKLKAK